jgi:hypothetical protein
MTRAQIIKLLAEYPDLARQILKMLPLSARREAYVLRQLYGLNSAGAPRRPADLAQEMGISLSRIYWLRKHGLILICQPQRKQVIVKYIMSHIVKTMPCKTEQNILNGFEDLTPDVKIQKRGCRYPATGFEEVKNGRD